MITLIAAVADNGVIGNKNELPWYIKEDLKRFSNLTANHPMVMGRRTYESVIARNGKPLPRRKHFLLTKNKNYQVPEEWTEHVIVCSTFEIAIQKAQAEDHEIFVIGGEKVFESALNIADKLEITHIHRSYEGDAYFPTIDVSKWSAINIIPGLGNDPKYEHYTYLHR